MGAQAASEVQGKPVAESEAGTYPGRATPYSYTALSYQDGLIHYTLEYDGKKYTGETDTLKQARDEAFARAGLG